MSPPVVPPHAMSRRSPLRRELLLRLVLPLGLIMAATAGLGTYAAHRQTARVYDHWLLDAAHSVAALVRFDHGVASVELSAAVKTVLLYDDVDLTFLGIAQGQRVLAGRADLPRAGGADIRYERESGHAYDAVIDGQPVRIATIQIDAPGALPVTVQMGETLRKRNRSEKDLLLTVWPMAALILAATAVIVLGVRRTLRPLETIAARWQEHSHASLEPVRDDDVPSELQPFARALNDLLGRIRAMVARERNFSTMVAHQMRTPLTALQLGLARAGEAADIAAARAVMQELSRATQRSARLVQQLLALGRLDPEAGGRPHFQRTDLVRLVQDVGAAHVDQAMASDIDFELICAPAAVVRDLQPELISEAISNLIDNALRYTPRGGRVAVELVEHPLQVRIADSGPGIAPDERERVFERFERGRAASGDGSGLGLAIVRDIAALHGAIVTLETSAWQGLLATLRFEPGDASSPRGQGAA